MRDVSSQAFELTRAVSFVHVKRVKETRRACSLRNLSSQVDARRLKPTKDCTDDTSQWRNMRSLRSYRRSFCACVNTTVISIKRFFLHPPFHLSCGILSCPQSDDLSSEITEVVSECIGAVKSPRNEADQDIRIHDDDSRKPHAQSSGRPLNQFSCSTLFTTTSSQSDLQWREPLLVNGFP